MNRLRILVVAVLITLTWVSQSAQPVYAAVIEVSGGIASSTIWTSGNIYRVTGDVTVLPGATLTIEPGTIIKFNADRRLIIEGKLNASGTAGSPIYFTSYRDDSIGGDTDGGGTSSGAREDWGWIEFRPGSDDTSLIEHATIRYGGQIACCADSHFRGNIYLLDASPTIRDSTLASANYGIYTSGASPTLMCNDIIDNSAFGIFNATVNTPINALGHFWGHSSGPQHPTLNPSGVGNEISDGVNFIPWRVNTCFAPPLSFVYLPFLQK